MLLVIAWFCGVVVLSGTGGYLIANDRHSRRNWRCFCDISEQFRVEIEAMRETRRQLEVDSRRYVLPSGRGGDR